MRLAPLVLGAVVSAGVIGYGVRRTGGSLTDAHRQVEAIANASTATAVSHAALEDAVSGDSTVDVDREVFGPLDHARDVVRVLVAGGKLPSGVVVDAAPATVRPELLALDQRLDRLHRLAVERLSAAGASGTPADQQYDAEFNSTLRILGTVERVVQSAAETHRSRIDAGLTAAVVVVYLMFAAGVLALMRQRTHALRTHETALRHAERESEIAELLADVSALANRASTTDEALRGVLGAVCRYTGWPSGHAYLVSDGAAVATGIWHLEDPSDFSQLQAASAGAVFRAGEGLPGRVLALRAPTSTADIADPASSGVFPRASAAAEAGAHGGFAFPALLDDEVVAVLEFFASDTGHLAPELVEVMARIGTEVGRVVHRVALQHELSVSREQAQAVIATANDAFVAMDEAGRITDWNRQAEVLFGWHREEVLGRELGEVIVPPQYRDAHRTGVARFLRTGTPSILGRQVQVAGVTRDGREVPVELVVWALEVGGQRMFNAFVRDISERQRAEHELQAANAQLTQWVDELEARNREVTVFSEMGDVVQSCAHRAELHEALEHFAERLFGSASGAVYEVKPSQNLLDRVVAWGGPDAPPWFSPSDCWALRRGRPHSSELGAPLRCRHLPSGQAGLCAPMLAQGEGVGVLTVSFGATAPDAAAAVVDDRTRQLAVTMAEHVGLALANFNLRDRLRHQSIRDPLTGLFNRRYLEETLERELARAARQSSDLGVAMIDVDHFKRFNDAHGHDAGDAVLSAMGLLLQRHVRGADIPCRYGGEEFCLILPEASARSVAQRMEQIAEAVRCLQIEYRGVTLGGLSVSVGVASYPEHGESAEAVLRRADAALYEAKAAGRDRVQLATADPSGDGHRLTPRV